MTCPTCPISLRTSEKFRDKHFIAVAKKSIETISFFLKENICCGYSLEAPHHGASNEYPQHMFSSSNKKNVHFWASNSWLDK